MSKKRILGVIGLGHVGAHVMYSLAVQGIVDEIVLVENGRVAQHGPKDEIFPQILANTISGCSYMSEGRA